MLSLKDCDKLVISLTACTVPALAPLRHFTFPWLLGFRLIQDVYIVTS